MSPNASCHRKADNRAIKLANTRGASGTFQIALVGCDGLVIGSDRLGRYVPMVAGKPQLPQIVLQPKYCVSDNGSLVCFAAGGAMAINLARQISADCDPVLKLKDATEAEWQDTIYRVTAAAPCLPSTSQIPDEILVARKDVLDDFWIILRKPGTLPTVVKMQQCFCTGTSTVAQFLPRHLWTPDRPVSELKKLALLTLSYAAQEEPSSVGAPFDIMTLDKTCHRAWSVHNQIHEKFQHGIERLFAEYDGLRCRAPTKIY